MKLILNWYINNTDIKNLYIYDLLFTKYYQIIFFLTKIWYFYI